MRDAATLLKEVQTMRTEVEEKLIQVIWTQLEKVLDSDAGVKHLLNKGFIPTPLGITEEYRTLMENIKVRKKFDKETVETFNKNVKSEVEKRMADLGWAFDKNGNVIPNVKG